MAHRALTTVLIGIDPPVEPGEIIPETYRDVHDEHHPVDFERLVEIGAAEKVGRRSKAKSSESTDGEDSDDAGEE